MFKCFGHSICIKSFLSYTYKAWPWLLNWALNTYFVQSQTQPLVLALVFGFKPIWVREDIRNKSVFLFDIVQNGGVVQPESKSFEQVLFSPILTLFWTLNGGRGGGVTMFQKFWGTFCLNFGLIFEFWAYIKVTSRLSKSDRWKSYLKCVQNGGVKATFGQCPKERSFFFWCPP